MPVTATPHNHTLGIRTQSPHDIALVTLNARYIHASLGLRYLYANMGALQNRTQMAEFTINRDAESIAETLLAASPRIVGFGVYIWNLERTTEVVRLLKIVRPELIIVVGGPEMSFDTDDLPLASLADYILQGQADVSFAEVCTEILAGNALRKVQASLPLSLDTLASPYPHYTDEDLAHRVIYVEASRGCPFKCEFCLSSLDRTAVPFALEPFLEQMQALIERGARQFKFVDRTFNLKAATSRRILEFFLKHIDKGLFLHFELIPDRLPDTLRELLPQFPHGSLQFEVGVQSFNAEVQARISRRQHHERSCENLRWLRKHTTAHVHADLIFGLPGENLQSFADGFDLLHSLGPQEIQVGILKRLRGTPITRHTEAFDLRFATTAPYRILSTRDACFNTVQRVVRFARYWDLVANSGRFPQSLPLILGAAPFARFMRLTDWLFAQTGQTHRIALPRLLELVGHAMQQALDLDRDHSNAAILADYHHNGLRPTPGLLQTAADAPVTGEQRQSKRQRRHLDHASNANNLLSAPPRQ